MPVQTSYPTAPGAHIAGQLHGDMLTAQIKSMFSGEASAEIPFGTAVKWGSTSDGKNAKQPAAESDKVMGIVVHSHSYENGPNGELGSTGVKPGGKLNVLRRGLVWVQCDSGCQPGDRLWVRAVAGGGERLGACENADDSTDMVDCTAQGEWMTPAAADGLALLSVDFTNK